MKHQNDLQRNGHALARARLWVSTLFAAALMVFSFSAQAVIIEVAYEGEVYSLSGNGLGYSLGDTISSSLFIDTDLASSDDSLSPNYGIYHNFIPGGAFVSGYVTSPLNSRDKVFIEDQYTLGRDRFQIVDGHYINHFSSSGTSFSTQHLSLIAISSLDFISGDGLLQSFLLTGLDNTDDFSGIIADYSYRSVFGIGGITQGGVSRFNLTRLAVGTPEQVQFMNSSALIPSPGSLALFALGLAGLGFSQRKRLFCPNKQTFST